MADDLPAESVIELAKALADLMIDTGLNWQRAFFRFYYQPNEYGCNGSYVDNLGVHLFDPFEHGRALQRLEDGAHDIAMQLRQPSGVLLLVIDSKYDFKIHFEYEDLERWTITKLDGASGIPEGF